MKKEQNSISSYNVALSSGLASILSTMISNPFEVLKIRLQADQLQCNMHEKSKTTQIQFKYIHEVALSGSPIKQNATLMNHQLWAILRMVKRMGFMSQTTHYHSNPFIKIYQSCSCIGSHSLLDGFRHIYFNEGPLTFLNGWRYAVLQAGASNICYFSFYEKSKKYLGELHLPYERILLPYLASGFSRTLTTTITFPLEYWKVLQSSSVGYTKRNTLELGRQLHSAYLITVQRDVIFSCIYWPLLENIKMELSKHIKGNHEIINLISGIMGGSITALLTLPLDVVKTRKQVSTRNDLIEHVKPTSTLEILQQIYYTEGIHGLFRGYQPRIAKVTMHSGLVYMMYEYFKEHLFKQF